MASDPASRMNASTGGYRDRFWIPRFWDGINVTGRCRLVFKNGFRISLTKIPMAFLMAVLSLVNSFLWAVQCSFLGNESPTRRFPGADLHHWPLAIGNHVLARALVLDSRHTFPNTYACFTPNHYVLTRRILPPLLKFLLPARRPMDNMAAGWHHPQEDEFALCCMGVPPLSDAGLSKRARSKTRNT